MLEEVITKNSIHLYTGEILFFTSFIYLYIYAFCNWFRTNIVKVVNTFQYNDINDQFKLPLYAILVQEIRGGMEYYIT